MNDSRWLAAYELVLQHGWNAVAYQSLNPGMSLWFARDGSAVAGFVSFARTRIIAGAPACAVGRLRDVADELEADAARGRERVVYFGAGDRLEQLFAGAPDHALVLLGAQPAWDPRDWSSIVSGKASLRAQLNRARNKGVVVEEWSEPSAEQRAQLRGVLAEWLSTRGLPPLGFMVTPDLLGNLRDRRLFVAALGSVIIAFLVATPVPAREGWLVEEWPRRAAAPNGTTHLLVDAAMRAFAASGSRYATLGLAPLSERCGAVAAGQPWWLALALRWLRAHGRRFYNFTGLESFKASMQPMWWEPVYAIAAAPRFTPGLLRAVAGAFSMGSPERLVLRAIWSAAAQEVSEAAARLRRSTPPRKNA